MNPSLKKFSLSKTDKKQHGSKFLEIFEIREKFLTHQPFIHTFLAPIDFYLLFVLGWMLRAIVPYWERHFRLDSETVHFSCSKNASDRANFSWFSSKVHVSNLKFTDRNFSLIDPLESDFRSADCDSSDQTMIDWTRRLIFIKK